MADSRSGTEARPPDGFEAIRSRAGGTLRTVIVRSTLRDRLQRAGLEDPRELSSGERVIGRLEGGRTPHCLIEDSGEVWVLKAYRRGGFLARWNRDRYWGRNRFLRELQVAVHAERSGVPTVDALAMVFEDAGLGSVRCWLLTRCLLEARPVREFLRTPREAAMARAAGEAVRRMHAAGIDHPDLNVSNLVGWMEEGAARVAILDWDGARCREDGTWSPDANLLRLWRSILKGEKLGRLETGWGPDGRGGFTPAVGLRAFLKAYFSGRRADLESAARYFRRRLPLLRLRSLFWRSRS